MRIFTDHLNRRVSVHFPPKRIVSLVPSQTELLFDLGLAAEVVGITKFCHHPENRTKAVIKIGGTKSVNLDLVSSLKPDLIIANKEENDRVQIETLAEQFPVWISDIANLGDALKMIYDIGELVNKANEAHLIANQITAAFASLPQLPSQLSVAYFIWQKPYMAAGSGTFINNMLQKCGYSNAIAASRYPELSETDLSCLKADIVMLSSEPYPFKQKHIASIEKLMPYSRILLVNGEMFSWYGSRLLLSVTYFKQLIEAEKY